MAEDAPPSKIATRVMLQVTERASLHGVEDVATRVAKLKALGFGSLSMILAPVMQGSRASRSSNPRSRSSTCPSYAALKQTHGGKVSCDP